MLCANADKIHFIPLLDVHVVKDSSSIFAFEGDKSLGTRAALFFHCSGITMATGANTTPLGRLHPVLQARSAYTQEPLLPLPVSMPGVGMPGVGMPGVSMPGVSMSGVSMSGVSMSGVSMPGGSIPGVSMPGVSMGGVGGVGGSGGGGGGGSKDPELKRHLEAAKRAASALFPGV